MLRHFDQKGNLHFVAECDKIVSEKEKNRAPPGAPAAGKSGKKGRKNMITANTNPKTAETVREFLKKAAAELAIVSMDNIERLPENAKIIAFTKIDAFNAIRRKYVKKPAENVHAFRTYGRPFDDLTETEKINLDLDFSGALEAEKDVLDFSFELISAGLLPR